LTHLGRCQLVEVDLPAHDDKERARKDGCSLEDIAAGVASHAVRFD